MPECPIGNRFGRLVVQYPAQRKGYWVFLCDCGTTKESLGSNIASGKISSCGCYRNEASAARKLRHGLTETKEYRSWCHIKNRCYNPNNPFYKHYGGRGIGMCERWRDSFESFLEDVGPAPSGQHSIDRVDNDGDYEPGNVRWADRMTQAGNKSNRRVFTYQGESKTLPEWARSLGISRNTLLSRIYLYQWPVDRALSEPVQMHRKKVVKP